MDASVIIACYNGAATLAETLDSLVAQVWDSPWEIVLADNGSTDASAAIFESYAARHPGIVMRRVDASAQRGKPAALNVGIAAARGRFLLFCDADDTVAPGWLAALGDALRQHDFVAARMDTRTLNPGWIGDYRRAADGTVLRRLTHPPYCDIAGGNQFGFRRSLFDAVGPFDPAFKVQEDHDFCIRAYLKGYRLHPVPEAVTRYRFRAETGAIFRQARSYAHYRALLRRRYAPEPMLAPRLWVRLALRLVRLTGIRLVRRRPGDPLEQARFAARLGGLLGEASGAFAFRVAPPRRQPLQVRPAASRANSAS